MLVVHTFTNTEFKDKLQLGSFLAISLRSCKAFLKEQSRSALCTDLSWTELAILQCFDPFQFSANARNEYTG